MDTTEIRNMGREAYEQGLPCAPALDPALMALIEGQPVGGDATRMMREWQEGWMAANLSDVPGSDSSA